MRLTTELGEFWKGLPGESLSKLQQAKFALQNFTEMPVHATQLKEKRENPTEVHR